MTRPRCRPGLMPLRRSFVCWIPGEQLPQQQQAPLVELLPQQQPWLEGWPCRLARHQSPQLRQQSEPQRHSLLHVGQSLACCCLLLLVGSSDPLLGCIIGHRAPRAPPPPSQASIGCGSSSSSESLRRLLCCCGKGTREGGSAWAGGRRCWKSLHLGRQRVWTAW